MQVTKGDWDGVGWGRRHGPRAYLCLQVSCTKVDEGLQAEIQVSVNKGQPSTYTPFTHQCKLLCIYLREGILRSA